MKILIVGLGNQGEKRKRVYQLYKSYKIITADPFKQKADYKKIQQVPIDLYEVVILCVPDNQKKLIIDYCIKNKKHVLVEKPLYLSHLDLKRLQSNSIKNKTLVYTAYNHRFEPNIIRLKKAISEKKLGRLYVCRLFYGNGTSKIVKNSLWKDIGMGVIPDLLPHLLDIYSYLFNLKPNNFKLISNKNFENKSTDHALVVSKLKNNLLQMEVSLCSWKNTFTCDLIFEKGSLHMESLCKWGPSKYSIRKRTYPSGLPNERISIVKKKDITWDEELKYFKKMINKNTVTDLSNDIWISKVLNTLK